MRRWSLRGTNSESQPWWLCPLRRLTSLRGPTHLIANLPSSLESLADLCGSERLMLRGGHGEQIGQTVGGRKRVGYRCRWGCRGCGPLLRRCRVGGCGGGWSRRRCRLAERHVREVVPAPLRNVRRVLGT